MILDFFKKLKFLLIGEKSYKVRSSGGQVVIAVVLFFLLISATATFGLAGSVFRQFLNSLDYHSSRESLYLADALAEDLAYRYSVGFPVNSPVTLSLNNGTASAVVVDSAGVKEIDITGSRTNLIRKIKLVMNYGSGGSFFYGVQVGEGGLWMYNTSSVEGNVHSSGPIKGGGNYIRGDALSAGSAGLIENIHATSSAYAHTIKDSTVDKNAYYTTIINTSVGGYSYPGSPDQATAALPISDEQIAVWEQDAEEGGVLTCASGVYMIDADVTIGPKKIPCNLKITGDPVITLQGALWVTGNIEVENTAVIKISPLLTGKVVPIIADNPADRILSSKIYLQNSVVFEGHGEGSYVLFISQNNSAESGGIETAVFVRNSVTGEVLVYSAHGNIEIENTVNLREVTSYKLTLRNSAKVVYKSGLANLLFSSGPSGGYVLDSWQEVY